jgi:hypothetical protein
MFASALAALRDRTGVQALVKAFLTSPDDKGSRTWERHEVGKELNEVVKERFYIDSFRPQGGPHGNFEEAAERFRVWWEGAQPTIHWDEGRSRWAW